MAVFLLIHVWFEFYSFHSFPNCGSIMRTPGVFFIAFEEANTQPQIANPFRLPPADSRSSLTWVEGHHLPQIRRADRGVGIRRGVADGRGPHLETEEVGPHEAGGARSSVLRSRETAMKVNV